MGLFGKVEYKKVELPFYFIRDEEDIEAGAFGIEAYGEVDGKMQYFYVCFVLTDTSMYHSGDYEEMQDVLAKTTDRKVVLNLKYKKGKIKGFILDGKELAKSLGDERFEGIEGLCWNWGEESVRK